MRRSEVNPSSPAATLRAARVADARPFLELFRALDAESEFMMFEPGERTTTLAQMRARLAAASGQGGRERLIVAERGNPVARRAVGPAPIARFVPGRRARGGTVLDGFVGAFGAPGQRNAHALNLVLGVRRRASGQGLGRRLLAAIEADARERGIHRLGLGVLASNERAIALYERAGFVREGLRRDAVRLRSGYVDELIMAKLLDG